MSLKTTLQTVLADATAAPDKMLARVKATVEAEVDVLKVHPLVVAGVAIAAAFVGFLVGRI